MQLFSNNTMLYTIDFDTELQSSNDYLLVPLVGVEPTNALRLYVLSVACLPFHHRGIFCIGYEARTRDFHIESVMPYQLGQPNI